MNLYETMYIIHPALQAGRLDDIISSVDNKISNLKGKKLFFDNWGKKKLSYEIDKQKYGTYVLLQFSLSGKNVHDLMDEFEHNANILRYLINKIDKNRLISQSKKEKTEIKQSEVENKQIKKKQTDTDNTKKNKEALWF